MNDVDLRAELAERIIERDAGRVAFHTASAAAQRAAELLAEAEAALAQYDNLDIRIAQVRGDRLANAIAAGQDHPLVGATGWLPDEMRDQLRERDRAVETEQTGRAASVSLDIALIQAEGALREGERRVTDAAVAILAAEAEQLSEGLLRARRMCWVLEDRLEGLTRVWVHGAPGSTPAPIHVPEIVRDALGMVRPQHSGHLPTPAAHQSRMWDQYLGRLRNDAVAEFVDHPPEPVAIPVHMQRRTVFTPACFIDAERLTELATAKAKVPTPAHAQSLIDLAVGHGTMAAP